MSLTTKYPIFSTNIIQILLCYPPKWFLLFRFSKQSLYSLLLYYMHATCHKCIIFIATIMMITSVFRSNRHESHYKIFCITLFLPPSHTKYSPHHPALTNPQSVYFSWCNTPNFTPTQHDRNNVSFTDGNMQHSEASGSKYCLNLYCSFFQNLSFSSSIFVRI